MPVTSVVSRVVSRPALPPCAMDDRGADSDNAVSATIRTSFDERVGNSATSCSILIEIALDGRQVRCFEQRQAKQHTRLLWILRQRRHEMQAVVLHLDIASDLTSGDPCRANTHDALF